MHRLAIKRPIATLAFTIALLFFGIWSFQKMPASLYPNVEFPFVTITTQMHGADPASIESKVTDLIEEAVSSIEGIDNISSVSAEGISFVFVQFKLEKDSESAANDVRDKIGAISLPTGVEKPVVQKLDLGATPIINMFVSIQKADELDLSKFVDEKLKPRIQRISGVGNINIVGSEDRVVAIYADKTRLARYGLDTEMLAGIVSSSNLKLGGGRIVNADSEMVIKTEADSKTIEDLQNLTILSGVRLSDVAEVRFALGETRSYANYKGQKGVLLEIQKISGENTLSVIKAIKSQMNELEKMAGDRFELTLINDSSVFIERSLNAVEFDMVYGAMLAVIIVFFFLRNFTATIVAALSLPTSILGTFFLMDSMGFGLDMLTLLGLTLAIGVLIDDAIVVIENIYKQIEKGKSSIDAALDGVREILFSLVSIAAVLLAVFIPVAFMQGIVGRFFFSFALTVSFGVVISLIVALTLIPMLSSRVLRSGTSRFYLLTEPFFAGIDRAYKATLTAVLRFKWLTVLAVVLITVLGFGVASKIGGEFLPIEDKSEMDIFIKAPVGTSVEAMVLASKKVQEEIAKSKFVEFTTLRVGYNTNRDAHKASVYVKLIAPANRPDQVSLMNSFRKELNSQFEDLQITVLQVPDIKVGDSESPFMLLLRGEDLAVLESASNAVLKLIGSKDGFVDLDTNYESGKPEISLVINKESIARLGISAQKVANAVLFGFSGEIAVGSFEESGKEIDIVLRVDKRESIEDLRSFLISDREGNMVSLDGIAQIDIKPAPNSINRFDRERQIMITASLDGLVLGDAVSFVTQNIASVLPEGVSYKFLGEAENMKDTEDAFAMALMLMFVIIFLILAALFESFIQPVIIMVALPLSFVGAFLALYLTNNNFNLFVMIGIMMLMGLVGKNSILLIDVANSARLAGKSRDEALLEAGEKRLRPILMTTFAIIFGMIPVAIGVGEGSEGKSPMGITIIGGLISSMFLTLLAVPAVYKILSPIDEGLRKWYER